MGLSAVGSFLPPILTGPERPPPSSLDDLRSYYPALPRDFFTPSDERILLSVFKRHQIADKMQLIDLLAYDAFQNLKKIDEELNAIESNGESFSRRFSRSLYFCYHGLVLKGGFLPITGLEAPSCAMHEKFLGDFSFIFEKCTTELVAARLYIQSLKQSPARASIQVKMMEHYKKSVGYLKDVRDIHELFQKILSSPLSGSIMLHFNRFCPVGGIQPSPARVLLSDVPAINEIQKFTRFVLENLKNWREAKKLSSQASDLITLIESEIKLLERKKVSIALEVIEEWGQVYHGVCKKLASTMPNLKQSMVELNQNVETAQNLNERQVVKELENRIKTLKNLVKAFTDSLIIDYWEDTINFLAEIDLFYPFFSKKCRSKDVLLAIHFQMLVYIQRSFKAMQMPAGSSDLPPLLTECQLQFNQQMYEAYQPLRVFFNEYQLESRNPNDAMRYSTWLSLYLDLRPACDLLNELVKKLPGIQREFERNLKSALDVAYSDGIQQGKCLEEIRKNCFKHIRRLAIVVSFLNDTKLFLEKGTFLVDLDYDFPQELRSLCSFLGRRLRKLFNQPRASQSEIHSPAFQSELKIIPETTSISPATLEPSAKEASTPSDSSNLEALLHDLKNAKKKREFIRVLEKLDFKFARYGKGTHEIWENEKGDRLVLSFHGNSDMSKPGTRRNIFRKVAESFEENISL